jgi:outer membrane beta-barrel protein
MKESRTTNLAKLGPIGLRSSALGRATTLAFALCLGLAEGTSAKAAPPTGGSIENPFERGGAEPPADESDGKDGPAAPEGADQTSTPPDEPAKTPGAGESASPGDGEADADAADEGAEPESALHALTCLEGDAAGGGRRKGVQQRDFLKRHRFELSGVGGFYASDALSSTYSYGGALAFYPSEDFGVEVLVTRSPVRFRLEEPFNSFDSEQHFNPGIAWQGMFSLLWSPIHAKLKFTDDRIIHADIFAVAGAGRTFHESVLGLTWEAGLGLKLYVSRYVTIRLDVRDFLLPQEILGRGRITNNVTVLAGVSLWLPG